MNMWPPALLGDLGSGRYDALLWIMSLMLLAQYVTIASSCNAVLSKSCRHFCIILSVGAACLDASELSVVSIIESTAHAR